MSAHAPPLLPVSAGVPLPSVGNGAPLTVPSSAVQVVPPSVDASK